MGTKTKIKELFFIIALAISLHACKKESAFTPERATSSGQAGQTSEIAKKAQAGTLVSADFSKLGDILASQLKNTIGYAAIISYNGSFKTVRSGGLCRQAQDAPSRALGMFDRYSIASVSKTVTAAALMKLFSTKQEGIIWMLAPIWPYLPSHWKLGPNIKSITFYQLLTHTSGFRYKVPGVGDGDDYQTLKALIANGVNLSDQATRSYNNRNFALLRLIIPKLANYYIPPVTVSPYDALYSFQEYIQAQQFANCYKDYCRKTIFEKLGSCAGQVIDCKNSVDTYPGLYYQYPNIGDKGFVPGDLSSVAGGQGWVLTTFQMDDFFRTLMFTETIVPKFYSNYMKDQLAGYDSKGYTGDNITYYWKNGIYNTLSGAGYRSLIIGFGDGIQMSIMANSPINLQNAAIYAHTIWYN